VQPSSIFKSDEDYINFEIELESEFEEKFPDENILFISEGSLTEIVNPNFKLGYDEVVFMDENPDYHFEIVCDKPTMVIDSTSLLALAA